MRAASTAAELSLDPKGAAPLASRRFVQHADPKVRARAVDSLKWLGPLGVPHHETLIPLVDDKDEEVVQAAARAIHAHAPRDSAAARAMAERKLVWSDTGRFVVAPKAKAEPPGVPELVRQSGAQRDDRRVAAALDLGEKGATAKDSVPALKKLLTAPRSGLAVRGRVRPRADRKRSAGAAAVAGRGVRSRPRPGSPFESSSGSPRTSRR